MACAMTQQIVALLGRRDEPTDGVEEYCRYLGAALHLHGFELALVRLPWKERGWSNSMRALARQAADWRGRWVCVQYTALAWSARGFPLRFVSVMNLLHRVGARVAVVYHDAEPHPGSRALDKLRRAVQLQVMRRSLRGSDLAIFTVPLQAISWISSPPRNAAFIPVGANLPPATSVETNSSEPPAKPLRVAVFGITGGEAGRRESARIVDAMRFACAAIGKLELRAFGRHADDRESTLREGLRDVPIDVQVKGVLPAEQVVRELCSADVLLFMRGAISTRRGSAIAGIACGLPVIAERGAETSGPIEEAGVALLSGEKPGEFGEALLQVLANRDYRAALAARSRLAQDKYFSWPAIAARYAEELRKSQTSLT
jgi:glycosyltransferase involved in cell wall biosynthesis